jgi:hypothetical protein
MIRVRLKDRCVEAMGLDEGPASFDMRPSPNSGRKLRMREFLYAIDNAPHPELAREAGHVEGRRLLLQR